MRTVTHFLLTAAASQKTFKTAVIPMQRSALLLGSVLPDVPFALLTIIYELYFRWQGVTPGSGSIMEYLHFTLFFTDPVWIIGHNFLHALIINGVLIGMGWFGFRRGWRWARPLFWLGIGTQFHTVIDIFTHHSDGPLLLFPFNWHIRFASPISYWEANYYGRFVTIVEYIVDACIAVYLIGSAVKRRGREHLKGEDSLADKELK